VPLVEIHEYRADEIAKSAIACKPCLVLVLTQTCDLAQQKTSRVVVARVFEAEALIQSGNVKAADVKGPIRSTRVWGWYFLPVCPEGALGEMVVVLRQIHSVPAEILDAICRDGHRKARLLTPYREHLAQHFAHTYSRIGLPVPYETL
jgi:hypothetical protein